MPITEEEAETGRRVILPSYITAMRTELATHMSLTCRHLVLMPPDQAPWQHWMTQLKQGFFLGQINQTWKTQRKIKIDSKPLQPSSTPVTLGWAQPGCGAVTSALPGVMWPHSS